MANLLQMGNRLAEKAMNKALKELNGPLAQEYEKLGVNLEFLYIKHLKAGLAIMERGAQVVPEIQAIMEKYNICTKKKERLDGNFFWITLRPADEHHERFGAFVIETNKYLQRAMFKNKIWCWEQKGEKMEDLGKGYHIHILAECRSNLMKTQLIKDTKSTFKRFLNGNVPDAFVQAEYVRTKEHYNNITAYMQGYKNDKWKDSAVALDPVWRARNNLNDIYGDTEDMLDPIPEAEVQNASN